MTEKENIVQYEMQIIPAKSLSINDRISPHVNKNNLKEIVIKGQ